jgi:hypothetical protein
VTVEGGGILHGTYMTFNVANVTVDAGGVITTEGKGYNTTFSINHDRMCYIHPYNTPSFSS